MKSCNGILAHIERKYALPVLHVNLVRRKKPPQLNDLYTGDGLREMLEEKDL